jgi:hypothetical protein
MYWAMLALTLSLIAGIALQLLRWLWGIHSMAVVAIAIGAGILICGYWSWRVLWKH